MRSVRDKFLIILCIAFFFVAGCGGIEENAQETNQSEYATVTFQVVWESEPVNSTGSLARGTRYAINPDDLCTVTVSVFEGDSKFLVAKDFDYIDHGGTIKVKAGSNRKFVIEGKLCSSGYIVFRGEKTVINLETGIRHDIGMITMFQDTDPPQEVNISINDGASGTYSSLVDLSFSAEDEYGVAGYYISESGTTPLISDMKWVFITEDKKSYENIISYPLSEGVNTVYIWFVDGAENISEVVSFSITYILGGPILLAPSDNSVIDNNTFLFDWEDLDGAIEYRIQVDNTEGLYNSDFSSPEIDKTVSESNYTLDIELPSAQYWWRVSAIDNSGMSSGWSNIWDITISLVTPSPPSLLTPINYSSIRDNTPLFDWNDSGGAVEYILQVDDNSDFSSPEIDVTVAVSSYAVNTDLSDGQYWWRVMASGSAGINGGWGSSWEVTIDTISPPSPNLLTPNNESISIDNTPLFDWADSVSAVQYNLQIDNNSDFSSPEIDATVAVSTYAVNTEFSDGEYWWRVSAIDNAGNNSDWSSPWKVSIDTNIPITTPSPPCGIYNTDILVTLSSNIPADIFYTTDGSIPTTNSNIYTTPIAITSSTTLKFFAKSITEEAVNIEEYVIDKVSPTISITSPTNNSTLGGTVNVSVVASDSASGINKVECYYDNNLIAIDTNAPYLVEWNTKLLPDGEYILKAKGFDGAGNIAVSAGVLVNTYNTPILSIDQTSIEFSADQTSKTFNITNSGAPGSSLNWVLSINPDDTNQWLSLSDFSGVTTTESIITLSVNRGELVKGQYLGKVIISSNGGNKEISLSMIVPNHCPNISSACPDEPLIDTEYTCDIDATDSDYDNLIYSLTNAPVGMTITPDTGLISWIPTSWGTYQVTVSVFDGECYVDQALLISVNLGGTLDKNTTLSAAKSPYVVKDNIIIPEDVTLTIEPGVDIRFNNSKALLVDGILVARGTEEAKITFTSNQSTPTVGDWGYILFSDSSADADYDVSGNYTSGSILEHCNIEYAGGINVDNNGCVRMNNAHPFINYCNIKNNSASGIYAWNLSGDLKIKNSIITDNTASGAGDSFITDNNASGAGGGIYLSGGSIIISDSTITDNNASGEGNGIYAIVDAITVSNSSISHNLGPGRGGGIYASCTTATISNNTINNNIADGGPWSGREGGGIWIYSSTEVVISANIIDNNTASGSGGGIYVGGGIATISDNIISNNIDLHYASTIPVCGGGIRISDGTVSISHNDIIANTSHGHGGGIYISGGEVDVSNNRIFNNMAKISSDGAGGGVGITGGIVTLSNNIITNNTAPSSSGGGIGIIGGIVTIISNFISSNIALNAPAVYYYCGDYCGNNQNFRYNTITMNKATSLSSTCTVYIGNEAHPFFNYNNIFGNDSVYKLWNDNNQGSEDVNAESNWWGTVIESEIKEKIYDWLKDPAKGFVDYVPWETAIRTDAPISPPIGFNVTEVTNTSVSLSWAANIEDDTAGYKIYYDTYTQVDPPYGNVVDVSSKDIVNYTLDLPEGKYYITITAYDTSADGTDDLFEGYESWYANGVSVTISSE